MARIGVVVGTLRRGGSDGTLHLLLRLLWLLESTCRALLTRLSGLLLRLLTWTTLLSFRVGANTGTVWHTVRTHHAGHQTWIVRSHQRGDSTGSCLLISNLSSPLLRGHVSHACRASSGGGSRYPRWSCL